MPVIRSAVKSVLSDVIREAVVSPWRYFATFDPVLAGYCELDAAVTFTGDFEVEWLCYSDVSTTYGVTSDAAGDNYIRLNGSTVVNLKIDGTVYSFSGLTLGANKLLTATIVRTGANAELFLDGVSQGTIAVSANDFVVSQIGRQATTDYFDGIIANVKLTDLATSSNSRIFPLALGPGSSVENSTVNSGSVTYTNIPDGNRERFTFDEANQKWVGDDEILTNGSFDVDSNWTKGAGWSIAGGQAIYSGSGIESVLYQSVTRPSHYRVTVDLAEIVGDGYSFYDGASYSTDVTVTGISTFDVVNGNAGYGFFTTRASVGDTSIKVKSLSVKRLLELA